MRIINPKFEILNQNPGIEGVLEQIKIAGQTCYDSESTRTPKDFVDILIKSGHGAMLEHGTIYLKLDITKDNCTKTFEYKSAGFTGHYNWSDVVGNIGAKYNDNPYSSVHYVQHGITNSPVHSYYITTNYRVIIENGWEEDLQFITDPTEYHEKRVTVRFTTQIAISREYNRHRVNSIAEQSTRYCNYSKDKYNGQVTFIKPQWVDEEELANIGPYKEVIRKKNPSCTEIWVTALLKAERSYLDLLKAGWTPQQARIVLPLDTRTELVHTAFVSDWKHFFDLRVLGTTGKPHPDAKILAEPLMEEFKRLKLI